MSSISNADTINKEKKDKLFELDYMRFIACLAVMIVHITATAMDTNGYIRGSLPYVVILAVNRSFKFTTPIFIFLSGVTSFYSYRKKEFKYFPFIVRRLEKVLVAYLVWCAVYYAAYIKLGYYSFDIRFFIDRILLGDMSYHLYFVIIITQMYIIGPVFYKMLKGSDRKITILIVAAIITALCAEYIRFKYSDRLFLKYMFFYMLGIFVTLEYDKYISWINKNKFAISAGYVIISAVYAMVSYYDHVTYIYVWFVFSIFSVFFVYYIGLLMKKSLSKLYSFIKLFGQSSYYIYLMHPLVLTLMIMYTNNNGILSVTKRLIIYFSTVIPITVAACLAFTALRNKIKKNKKAALTASSN
jgi:peptidoglycan/LPS O-acetylase OafA/YrhL